MIKSCYIRKAVFTVYLSIALISTGSAIAAAITLERQATPDNTILSSEAVSEVKRDEIYYIKEHGEVIGVFDGEGELLFTVEVYVKTLPAADRALLKKGIAARDREELYEILGDYDA